MIYEDHLLASEMNAWTLQASIAWNEIDREAAASQPELLTALHDAALIEGYLPVFVPRLMQLLWDDVDATAVLSLELYEGLKHYTALKRYLDIVGYPGTPLAEEALVTARGQAIHRTYSRDDSKADVLTSLTHFMCSELFAGYFFLRLSRQARDPVLKQLLIYMARDEFRHSAGAGDLLKKRLDADPGTAPHVLAAAENFRHYGNDVVEVPVAEENDFEAIMAMNRKIRLLCGVAPTEHLRGAIQ